MLRRPGVTMRLSEQTIELTLASKRRVRRMPCGPRVEPSRSLPFDCATAAIRSSKLVRVALNSLSDAESVERIRAAQPLQRRWLRHLQADGAVP